VQRPCLLLPLQIRLLEKGASSCGRTVSQQIEVPSPEQISTTVRACLARPQQLMDSKSLLESGPILRKVSWL